MELSHTSAIVTGGASGLGEATARLLAARGAHVVVADLKAETGEASEAFKAKLGTGVLFPKRLGQPAEFATLAIELLANSYMNAETIRLDAGIRMQPK